MKHQSRAHTGPQTSNHNKFKKSENIQSVFSTRSEIKEINDRKMKGKKQKQKNMLPCHFLENKRVASKSQHHTL